MDGRAYLIDNIASVDGADPYVEAHEDDLDRRVVKDGTHFRVVKVMYTADELTAALAAEGWGAHLDTTSRFVFGSATPL